MAHVVEKLEKTKQIAKEAQSKKDIEEEAVLRKYTVRVEILLKKNEIFDYEKLHTEFRASGLKREITGIDNNVYLLPSGEYSITTKNNISTVLKLTKTITTTLHNKFRILVTESCIQRKFYFLEKK
jgi:hypothetical protein